MKNQGKAAHNNRENSGHPPSVDNISSIPLICLLMKLRWLAGILVALMICPVADAEEKPPLRIGIHEMAPYATRNADGAWDGLGVELWKNIAATTGVRFVFVEMPFEQILPAVADGKLDAAVGEMTVTAERERAVRFTQPYLISSAGAAMYPQVANADWKTILGDFFNWTLAFVLLGILAGMVLVSLLIWAIEHQHDAGHFRGGLTGFGSALWFSASTVTGVGYGDKIPASFAGRVISFVWMLMGVLLVAGLTATVTANMSAARVANLNGPRVKELGDLRHFSCGVMRGSLTQQILIRDGVGFRDYETFGEAFQALADGKIEAVVGDKTCLRYLVRQWKQRTPPVHFSTSSVTNENVFMGIPTRPGLPEYHEINLAVLQAISTASWHATISRWLGERAN